MIFPDESHTLSGIEGIALAIASSSLQTIALNGASLIWVRCRLAS